METSQNRINVSFLFALTATILASVCISGCQGEPEVVETQASKDMAASAASAWTPEKIKIFAAENKKARAGLDK
ncbi:MAG: hypothetical protein WCK51_06965 [Armatimonadota bacterium]